MAKNNIKFIVTLNVSNNNTEDVRCKLKDKLDDWLDNVSFITNKKEICKKVEIYKAK